MAVRLEGNAYVYIAMESFVADQRFTFLSQETGGKNSYFANFLAIGHGIKALDSAGK